MRTNIDIDDVLMDAAMRAGPYTTKRDAVEAGLKLLARQAAYREILKWEGKLKWDGEPWSDRDPFADDTGERAPDAGKPPSATSPDPSPSPHARQAVAAQKLPATSRRQAQR